MAEEKKDKAEYELDLASDCSWVRALDANGKPIRILKSDLLGAMFQEKGNVLSNLDNYIEAGVYGINMDLYNIPILEVEYGMLIVFTAHGLAVGGSPIVQFVISAVTNPIIHVRTKWISSWTTWKQISFT